MDAAKVLAYMLPVYGLVFLFVWSVVTQRIVIISGSIIAMIVWLPYGANLLFG